MREKDITLKIAHQINRYLQQYAGVEAKMSRTKDETLSLQARTNMANAWHADYYVSIHINSGKGTGFESYIYNKIRDSSRTNSLRNVIHDEVMKVTRLRDRGKKKANFHVLRESTMAASLTENGFIDTKADADKMKDSAWIDALGKAYAAGIAKAFRLKGKSSETSKPRPTAPKAPETSNKQNSSTAAYLGTSIVDYLKSIGADSSFQHRKQLAAQAGMKHYSGTLQQNNQLLANLRSRKANASNTVQSKGNLTTGSIVDYLKSINVDASFQSRKRLAAKHGIPNYTGTARQNSLLLHKIRAARS